MSKTLIRRVAKAIANGLDPSREHWAETCAVEALDQIFQPTRAMIRAGMRAGRIGDLAAERVWKEMFYAMMKDADLIGYPPYPWHIAEGWAKGPVGNT